MDAKKKEQEQYTSVTLFSPDPHTFYSMFSTMEFNEQNNARANKSYYHSFAPCEASCGYFDASFEKHVFEKSETDFCSEGGVGDECDDEDMNLDELLLHDKKAKNSVTLFSPDPHTFYSMFSTMEFNEQNNARANKSYYHSFAPCEASCGYFDASFEKHVFEKSETDFCSEGGVGDECDDEDMNLDELLLHDKKAKNSVTLFSPDPHTFYSMFSTMEFNEQNNARANKSYYHSFAPCEASCGYFDASFEKHVFEKSETDFCSEGGVGDECDDEDMNLDELLLHDKKAKKKIEQLAAMVGVDTTEPAILLTEVVRVLTYLKRINQFYLSA